MTWPNFEEYYWISLLDLIIEIYRFENSSFKPNNIHSSFLNPEEGILINIVKAIWTVPVQQSKADILR